MKKGTRVKDCIKSNACVVVVDLKLLTGLTRSKYGGEYRFREEKQLEFCGKTIEKRSHSSSDHLFHVLQIVLLKIYRYHSECGNMNQEPRTEHANRTLDTKVSVRRNLMEV